MASVTARGALPLATARPRRLRRLLPAAAAAAPLGPGSVAARLAQQLRQLKQFKVWDAPAASASGNAHPAARGGRQPGATLQGAPTDGAGAPGAASGRRPGVVWFRGDLRLHDHEALARAQAECSSLLPVYCFDPRDYGKSPQGHEKTGPFRALFLAEAVADLRVALRAAGSELVVRLGRPEEVIGELVRRTGAGAVYCHTEVTYEELRVEAAVKAAAEAGGAQLRSFWGATLAHRDDLPFALRDLPQNFDALRARAESVAPRAVLQAPQELRGLPLGGRVDPGDIPSLQQLGLAPLPKGARAAAPQARGGEGEALLQLRRFLAVAAETGGAAGGAAGSAYGSNFASSIAPWLATGCLSPRRVLEDAARTLGGGAAASAPAAAAAPRAAQQGQAAQQPLSWVRYELLWRDFFRFMAMKYSSISQTALGRGSRGGATGAPAVAAAAQPALALAC